MWEGVTPVAKGHDPIVCEGPAPERVVIMNAGPGAVRIRTWNEPKPPANKPPAIDMEIRAGDTRAVIGHLVRLQLMDRDDFGSAKDPAEFAAVGWRVNGWWGYHEP